MSNRVALYRKTLRELYKERHELEDTLQYLETRKRLSYRKIEEAEDNIEDCQDDIDTVRNLLKRALKRKKPAPKKRPTPKKPKSKPEIKRKPFEAPHVQRKPAVRKPAPVRRAEPVEDIGEDYDEGSSDYTGEESRYVERYGEDALEDLEEYLEDFPELEEYINDDIFEMDDEDFYGGTDQ
jgi:hypothetical protein